MNILLIQLKRIGDLILTTPAIAAVRKKFPRANISLIISAGCRELLPAITGLDRIFIARGKVTDTASWFSVAARRFDYCLDFTRNDRSAFLTLLSGAKKRITADHPRQRAKIRALSYNELVDCPIRLVHTVDYHLALLAPLGIRAASAVVRLNLPVAAVERARRILDDAEVRSEFVLLHPGSARAEKFWEPERWAALISWATEHNLSPVLTGGNSPLEQTHIARIKSHARHPFVDLSGQVDLLTLAALIQRARLLTTVDSAPMHLAVATQTPQVVLFGPTNPLHWHPRFTPAIILQAGHPAPVTQFSPKQKPVPMNLISTEQVIDAMKALLAAGPGLPNERTHSTES
ncbi:MAG: putative lipopolysaccharide heptosyltransferase III [Chthoniobacterales bacterium]|nr:putative lipopolysaccharide heptosyltransferase III [Chthoniobacterales bacterium]